jgi:phosphatidate phosphatase APP1
MLKRLKKFFGLYAIKNILIIPYRSYGSNHHLYVKGRVLDDVPLKIAQNQFFLKTLQSTYKQFDTYEIPNAEIELTIGDGNSLITKSDNDGYILFDSYIDENIKVLSDAEGWVEVQLIYKNTLDVNTMSEQIYFKGEFLIPKEEAEFGVISDIDDTILHTGVTSFLKWRLLKNSLLTNAYKRIPLKGAPEFYQKLHLGKSKMNKNPIFYISNSPWNLYQYLKLFLDHNKFPKGPILLRSFKSLFHQSVSSEKPHKQKEIINILNSYPHLKFILIGDSGEHDASIYTDIAVQYPDRILAIYLKSVNHRRQMRRIKSIVDNFRTVPVLMAETSFDAEQHAKENGFIS